MNDTEVHIIPDPQDFRGKYLSRIAGQRLSTLLIEHFPYGIPGSQLPSVYYGIFGNVKDIDSRKYGFSDVRTLLSKEPKLVRIDRGYIVSSTFNNKFRHLIGSQVCIYILHDIRFL